MDNMGAVKVETNDSTINEEAGLPESDGTAVEVVVDRTDETLSKIAVVDGKGTAPTVLVASEEFGPGGTTFARSNSVAAWTVFMTWSISSDERLLVINCPPCPCKAAF